MFLLNKIWQGVKTNAYYIYLVVAILLTGAAAYVLLEPELRLHEEGYESITQLFYIYITVALVNYGYFFFYSRKRAKREQMQGGQNEQN
ncbi:hypothetical protein SAMN04488134_101665 [Amphibacillus marinus]|uniref:Uncharacterized protein n=1 Tax=Amphibacillus marinus TaxID=872970 RepID=A0A1H8IPD8_9BACI|nr:hypothetical protein [Amphibacillus marinus]SEN69847.1 hypothetical protein SAMN04488134_101665 [Amphibacillus marinus]